MMIAVSTAILLAAAQAGPTVAEIDRLTPRAAGVLALKSHDHRQIVDVVTPPVRGLEPPGVVERELVERPVVRPGGCVRARWKVSFTHKMSKPATSAILSGAYASPEVALAQPSGCVRANFVRIDRNLNPVEAFAALHYLDDLRAGRTAVTFSCSDQLSTGLCDSDATIRAELARLTPWAVIRRDGATLIWFNDRGRSTEVRFSSTAPGQVGIERRIPPPA